MFSLLDLVIPETKQAERLFICNNSGNRRRAQQRLTLVRVIAKGPARAPRPTHLTPPCDAGYHSRWRI